MTRLRLGALIQTSIALFVLGVWALLSLFPLYWNAVAAFLPVDRMFSYPPQLLPTSPTLQNFRALHQYIPTLWWNILNSLILAVVIPLVTVFFGTLAGFAFAKLRFWGQEALFYVIIATLAVPPLIGYIPLFLFMTRIGLGNTLWAVFFPSVIGAFGIFLFRQTMETIPDELIDAATVDGVSNFVVYRVVAVPLVRPLVITLLTVGFLAAFNDYFWPLIILRTPQAQTFPVALASIEGQIFQSPWGALMAGCLVLMVPAVLIFSALSRYIIPNTTAGALKG